MNTNIAENYAKTIIDTKESFTKKEVIELIKQAYIDGMSGNASIEDTKDFVDDGSDDYISTEDDVDINEFDAFTPSFMQK